MRYYRHVFHSCIRNCKLTPFSEIDVNTSAASGAFCKGLKKGQWIYEHYDEVWNYYQYAHIAGWKVPYVVKIKQELLKYRKVQANIGRIFVVEDVLSFITVSRCMSDMGTKMSYTAMEFDTPFMKGWSPFYGGVVRLARHLSRIYLRFQIFKTDCKKWDKGRKDGFHDLELPITEMFITLDDLIEWYVHMAYHFDEQYDVYVVDPMGNVYIVHTNNPSGRQQTTDSNNREHACIVVDLFITCTNGEVPIEEMSDHITWYCMSDDNIVIVNLDSPYAHKFLDPQIRADVYKRWGRSFKPEDDVLYPPNTVENVHWLGLDLKQHPKYGWVGVYDIPKLVTSLALEDDLDLRDKWMKCESICLLGCWDDLFFTLVHKFTRELCYELKMPSRTQKEYQQIWLDGECASQQDPILSEISSFCQKFFFEDISEVIDFGGADQKSLDSFDNPMSRRRQTKQRVKRALKQPLVKEIKKEVKALAKPMPKKKRSKQKTRYSQTVDAPASRATKSPSSHFSASISGNHGRVHIRELQTTINIPANGYSSSQPLMIVAMNPNSIGSSKLRNFSANFERFRIKRITYMAVSAQGSNVSGNYGLAYIPDPVINLSTITQGDLTKLAGSVNSFKVNKVWENLTLNVRDADLRWNGSDYLWVDQTATTLDESRWSSQGQVVLYNSGPLFAGSSAATELCDVYVDVDIEFSGFTTGINISGNSWICTGTSFGNAALFPVNGFTFAGSNNLQIGIYNNTQGTDYTAFQFPTTGNYTVILITNTGTSGNYFNPAFPSGSLNTITVLTGASTVFGTYQYVGMFSVNVLDTSSYMQWNNNNSGTPTGNVAYAYLTNASVPAPALSAKGLNSQLVKTHEELNELKLALRKLQRQIEGGNSVSFYDIHTGQEYDGTETQNSDYTVQVTNSPEVSVPSGVVVTNVDDDPVPVMAVSRSKGTPSKCRPTMRRM